MTNSALNATHGSDSQTATRTLPISRAILYATLVVGVLDATDGVVFLGLHGQNPIQVLQYIASSLLGVRSFSGGLSSAGIGLVLHFAVSLVVVTIYILASRRVAVLRTHWMLMGLLYGAAVWAVMNILLLPFTAVAAVPIATAALVNGLMGHALFVGVPCGFFAKSVETTGWAAFLNRNQWEC